MKKLVKCLVVLLAFTMIEGMAYSENINEHVKVAPNHLGDLMVLPFYLALDGGWDTKICVTNTSTTHSAVAKVIFRSWVNSEEVLDFFLYLTPTDKWCGRVYFDGTGAAIYSEDDSVLVGADGCEGTFASADVPMDQAFFPVECDDDMNYFGYAEIIEIWSQDITTDNGQLHTGEHSVVPQDKTYLYRTYCTWQIAGNWDVDEIPSNILTGGMEFYNETTGYYGERKMKVLRDYQNREHALATADTVLGDDARNSLAEIEAALSTRRFVGNYYNGGTGSSIHFFTFPTKLTNVDVECNWMSNGGAGELSPFWSGGVGSPYDGLDTQCAIVSTSVYDMSENTIVGGNIFSSGPGTSYPMCQGVTMLSLSSAPFTEGWIAYGFAQNSEFTNAAGQLVEFSGVPGIMTQMNFAFGGMSLSPGAWDDGVVNVTQPAGTPVYIPYYQYADFPTAYTGPVGFLDEETPDVIPTTGTVNFANPGSNVVELIVELE